MGLKDILVHVDCSKANAARLQAAIGLAQRHGAHVTGLFVIPRVNMPAYAEFQVGPVKCLLFGVCNQPIQDGVVVSLGNVTRDYADEKKSQ